ncbi:MAG TPA: glycosyltransferase family 4 protein [Chitinophagaceae bacterium]|nr:glycosyltransferase family 4 protein [Chitinophagaceae bacterium]
MNNSKELTSTKGMKSIGILFKDFGPYHVARMEALADALNNSGRRLVAFRIYETSRNYGWITGTPNNAQVITLGNEDGSGVIEAFKVAYALSKYIRKEKIDAVLLPSYSPFPNMLCVFSARLSGTKLILMNDSWKRSEKASLPGRMLKHVLVRMFNSALVAGTPQKEFACSYGQQASKVFLGFDVVDIKYYAEQAKQWHAMAAAALPVTDLPPRYFLSLGRFATKKNIALLVKAYAALLQRRPSMDIALVLVGDGEEKLALRQLVNDLQLPMRDASGEGPAAPARAEVVFYPFQQVDRTPLFFARCEAFVLPSMYEEWGLVVNEAMACSSPVIVSAYAGCATDLVVNGVNGFTFDPSSVEQLSSALEAFVTNPQLSAEMGKKGYAHIQQWGPERFAEGAINAIEAAVA